MVMMVQVIVRLIAAYVVDSELLPVAVIDAFSASDGVGGASTVDDGNRADGQRAKVAAEHPNLYSCSVDRHDERLLIASIPSQPPPAIAREHHPFADDIDSCNLA